MKNTAMHTKTNYRQSLSQRITASVMAGFMLAQICMPSLAVAAILMSDEKITGEVMSDVQYEASTSSSYLYQRASYLNQVAPVQNKTIDSFYKDLVANKIALPNPTFIPIAGDITIFIPTYPVGKLLGDNYVQNRFIRSQINGLLGRHLIDFALYPTELDQINKLYASALAFAHSSQNTYIFGQKLPSNINQDMIWPEWRTINGERVLVPIVYLSDNTIATRGVKSHIIENGGDTVFENITLDKVNLIARRNALIAATNNITNNGGTIIGEDSLNLFAGATLSNISGKITAKENVTITANQINNKTIVVPYAFKNGTGTRLGEIASIDAENGNLSLQSYGDIIFEGATANANGTITFNAANNISIRTQTIQSQSTGLNGHWQLTNSSIDSVGSKITANETIRLMAGGTIEIAGSEIHSTKGGIEILAKQGIYILDAQGQSLVQKVDKIGKTQGTASDFNSWAIRSALDAGKGVLLYTEGGDVVLKGADISSVDGTQVTAKNGKVHLLLSKEQSQHYLDTVRKGKWTIKTTHVEEVVETGTPNAIIGGFAVEAMQGIDIEYTGKEGATLAEQIEEYRNMPSMKWMADLYDQNRNNVNWDEVELVYKNIHKTNRSLSPAAMAIIAIAVCVAMGPAGLNAMAGINTAVINAVGSSVAGAALSAGAVTLATSATQSLAAGNSLGDTINAMDSDENLKSLAISMATAGAMNGLDVDHLEIFKAPAGEALNPALDLVNQSYQAVARATVTAGVSVSINGGNSDAYRQAFTQSLAVNVVNTLGQNLINKISGAQTLEGATKYISQAGMGCLTQGLTNKLNDADFKDACMSGAGGAVIAQGLADTLDAYTKNFVSQLSTNTDAATAKNMGPALKYLGDNGVDVYKLIAAFTAYAVGGDVNAAAAAAGAVAQGHKENLLAAANLGGMLIEMGATSCGEAGFAECTTNLAKAQTRDAMKARGIYTDAQIAATLSYLDSKGFFAPFGRMNAAFYNNGATAEGMARLLTDGSRVQPESSGIGEDGLDYVIVNGDTKSQFVNALFDVGVATGKAVETSEKIIGDAIEDALNTSVGKPIKIGLSWVGSKGKEAYDNSELIKDTVATADELSKLYGTGALSYLFDSPYSSTKAQVDDPGVTYEGEATYVTGMSWLGNAVTGFAVARLAATTINIYMQPGAKSFIGRDIDLIKVKFPDAKNVVERDVADINKGFIDKGYEAPYKPTTEVVEFTSGSEKKYLRVHGSDNKGRSWMMEADDIKGLTAVEIQSKFALPTLPTFVSEVYVPAGTPIRTGIVNPIFGGVGNARQFELLIHLQDSYFQNTKSLF